MKTRFSEYQVIGRKLPSEADPNPKLYRMRVFAPNPIVAKSRFWYFLRQLKKNKAATGEIVNVTEVGRAMPMLVNAMGFQRLSQRPMSSIGKRHASWPLR